jgi:hypothetical protein
LWKFTKEKPTTMKKALLGTLLILAATACGTARLQTSPQEMERIAEALRTRDYTVEVVRADPMGWRTVNLDYGYGLTVRGDSIFSRLPFYGRAYSVPFGGGDGLFFKTNFLDYSLSAGRKGSTVVNIAARTDEDTYLYSVTVWPNGNARISVNSFNRQKIAYDGTIVLKK